MKNWKKVKVNILLEKNICVSFAIMPKEKIHATIYCPNVARSF